MPFADIKVTNAATAKAAKSKIPVYRISSATIQELNKASADLDDAKARFELAHKKVQDIGVRELAKRNVTAPLQPLSSLNVEDTTENSAMVTLTNRYKLCDEAVAVTLFEDELHCDVSSVVRKTVKASFDSSVFLTNGQFDQAKYDAFHKAVMAVAAALNVEDPLSSKIIIEPLDNFHDRRWVAFPTVEKQLAIQAKFPCTVQVRPGDYVENQKH
jgi:hypothetical protein